MLATNIQRFSLHDGPGIRTTVFLKGCSLNCPWCSNPENIHPYKEKYKKNGTTGIYGVDYTIDDIFNEVVKDINYYDCNGGVTFSGGEPLLFTNDLIPLLEKIKQKGITIAVETSLFAPIENLKRIIPYIDFFYVDMKILDENRCKNILSGNLNIYKKNLDYLCSMKKITIRIPVIGDYTDSSNNQEMIIKELIKHKNSIMQIELLKEHNLGESKYLSLEMPKPKFFGVSDEFLAKYKSKIQSSVDIPVKINKV